MFVGIIHDIRDPVGFRKGGEKLVTGAPVGFRSRLYLPSEDGRKATCLWEAPTVGALQALVDQYLGEFADNDCYAVNEREAQGLPRPLVEAGAGAPIS